MKRYAPALLAGGALATILTELLRYWLGNHPPEWWVLSLAALLGFFGFYLLNPAAAKDAFGFATDQAVKVIGVVRSGRRSTDPVVAVTQVRPTTAAVSEPHVIVGSGGDVLHIEPDESTAPSATDSEHDEVIP